MAHTTVLTGASSGIGAELAVLIAARGEGVALLARRREQLGEVAERARAAAAHNGHAPWLMTQPVDVTDRDAVHRIFGEIEAERGAVDRLILNAGISENLDPERYDDRLAARILEVNLVSATYALGAALPGMVARRSGHIVGVSSIAGYRGLPGASAYSASKAGLSTLLESLRADLRRHAIAVTTVSPGFVRTPMTAKNAHKMPFLIDAGSAARLVLRGIDRHRRELRFPWQTATLARLLRAMPDWLYDRIAARVKRPASKDTDREPFGGAR